MLPNVRVQVAGLSSLVRTALAGVRFLASVGVHVFTQVSLVPSSVAASGTGVVGGGLKKVWSDH